MSKSPATIAPQSQTAPQTKEMPSQKKPEQKKENTSNTPSSTGDDIDFLKVNIRAHITWIKKSTEDDAELVIKFASEPTGVLMVKPWMSSMAEPHGGKYNCFMNGSTDCKITPEPGTDGKNIPGSYRIKGISFPMKGRWDLIFILKKTIDPESERVDQATLSVEI